MEQNALSNSILQSINTHSMYFFLKGNNTNSGSGNSEIFNYIFMITISTVMASIIPTFILFLSRTKNKGLNCLKKINLYRRFFNENIISLSYQVIVTKYGRKEENYDEFILGILHYIKLNCDKIKGLYSLHHETLRKYDSEIDDYKYLPLFKINQPERLLIKQNPKIWITQEILDSDNDGENTNNNFAKIIQNKITLTSNEASLKQLKDFLHDCKKTYINSRNDDDERFIYTYMGMKDDVPKFKKEEFKSYSDFSTLFSSEAKTIEKAFDFFVSLKGKEWYSRRNLPYHLTVLLHGEPGTGKSAIAAAIAKKYSLHIVKIKLSSIKTNMEFIKVFKCKKFVPSEPEKSYENILYMFDEIDTETNEILLDRSFKKTKDDETKTDTELILNTLAHINTKKEEDSDTLKTSKNPLLLGGDKLSLGTILEEFSGINQMWGRKMIFISNYPEKLEKALLRPGRVDHNIRLKKMSRYWALKLILNFFELSELPDKYHQDDIPDKKITPAELLNDCKIAVTIENLFENFL